MGLDVVPRVWSSHFSAQDIFVGLRSYGRVGNRGRCGTGPPLPYLCRLNEAGAFHTGCVLSPEAVLTIVNASSHPTPQHRCILKCLQVILSPSTLFSCPTFFPGYTQSRLGSSLSGVPSAGSVPLRCPVPRLLLPQFTHVLNWYMCCQTKHPPPHGKLDAGVQNSKANKMEPGSCASFLTLLPFPQL